MTSSEIMAQFTASNFAVLDALEEFQNSMQTNLKLLEPDAKLSLSITKDLLKDVLKSNINVVAKLKKHFGDTMDLQNSLCKTMKSLNGSSESYAETLKFTQKAHAEKKMNEVTQCVKNAKTSLIVHNLSLPENVSNPVTIRKHVDDLLSKNNISVSNVRVLSKLPKNRKISVQFDCEDLQTKQKLSDCCKNINASTSQYNTPYVHTFMSKIRKLYAKASHNDIKTPQNNRHIFMKTNYDCNKIIVLIKSASESKWTMLESLSIPIPSKFVSNILPQTCSSKYIDIQTCIPEDFS